MQWYVPYAGLTWMQENRPSTIPWNHLPQRTRQRKQPLPGANPMNLLTSRKLHQLTKMRLANNLPC